MTWRDAVLSAIARIQRETFTLQELYGFADEMAQWFPSNMNVEAKIRQQMQYLREEGLVEFLDYRGTYRLRRLVRPQE